MRKSRRITGLATAATLVLGLVVAFVPMDPSGSSGLGSLAVDGTLESALVTASPTLDGNDNDAVWGQATLLTITVSNGANTVGNVDVDIRSVYYGGKIYFVAEWNDAQDSKERFPWYYNTTDDMWKQLGDQTTGDENTWYEDKLAVFWSIDNAVTGFDSTGCMVACHGDLHYTNAPTEYVDMWHWKRVRNVNQMDDQYMDDNQTAAEGGRHSDPKVSGGYNNNLRTLNYTDDPANSTSVPGVWIPNAPAGSDDRYFVKESDMGSKAYNITTVYKSNGTLIDEMGNVIENPDESTRLPGIRISPITGDRGNISAGWKWESSQWTLEFGRDLVTGSAYDVQFNDTSEDATYYFGLSVFNNAQIDHNWHANVYALNFEQPNQAPGAPTVTVDDTTVEVGDEVEFTASATDPDGDTLTYAWDFDDGETGTGATVTHSFEAAGEYTVRVNVSDGNGGTSTATVVITVEEGDAGISTTTLAIVGIVAVLAIAGVAFVLLKRKKTPPAQ